MKKKICVFTGARSDYGLLYWLMKEIQADPELELQIIASGMHLSPEFGQTYNKIEADGFEINEKIEILLSSDSPVGITKSMGLGLISFSEAFSRLKPDLLVGLGDRYELHCAAVAATVARIPIAHLHGGEISAGAIDEAFRHSITKMSHLHFTASNEYRQRVIQLGEDPSRVFNFGALGLDNIYNLNLLDKQSLQEKLGFEFGVKNIIVTYHPVTLENDTAGEQFMTLLNVIDKIDGMNIIFTKPNSDTGGRVIIDLIERFVEKNRTRSRVFDSLGQLLFLSILQYADGMVGNSSSGLIEMPAFKKATINIGDRQLGRLKASSVIDCDPNENSISNAFSVMYSEDFQRKLHLVENPYGSPGASVKIKNVIREYNLKNLLKKKFYNIQF